MAVADFIALDVETANSDFASICSIGLVHFRQGKVFKSLTILVDPEDEFSPANIAIHGITPEDVVGKPTMAQVLPVISGALARSAIVHHSPFDRTAFARAAAKHNAEGLPCFWLDSLQVARRAWDHFGSNGGYGLKNLASSFGINFRHHDAAEDARAAGLIMLRAIEDTRIGLQSWIDDIGYESTVGEATECQSAHSAIRKAEQLAKATGNVGAVAFSRTGDPNVGEFSDAVLLKAFGDLPSDLSGL